MKYLKIFSVIFMLAIACSNNNSTDSGGPEPREGDITVLFIGNSLTSNNQQPNILSGMARTAGKQIFVEQVTVNGASLDNLSRNSSVLSMIKKYKWDYVVLQGSDFSIAFPDYHFVILPGIETLRDSIKSNNIQTDIIFFMNYGYEDGNYFHSTLYDYDDIQTRIYNGTLQLCDDLKFMIAPVGWAWKSIRDQYPDIELYASDGQHPSLAGSYLGACVYFAMIFIDDLEGVNYNYGIQPTTAEALQGIGCSIVLNSLRRWNIY